MTPGEREGAGSRVTDWLRAFDDDRVGTHYEGCWKDHQVCALLYAADEIDRLVGLVAELLPYAVRDAEQGLLLGSPPEGGCDGCAVYETTCPDCDWFEESAAFMGRLESGFYQV